MSGPLTCCLCGHQGWDVRMTGIDRGESPDLPVVDVSLPLHERPLGPPELHYVKARERFIREPRCEDQESCRERLAEATP